jgi:hypothetical protein
LYVEQRHPEKLSDAEIEHTWVSMMRRASDDVCQEYVHALCAAIEVSVAALTARDPFPERGGRNETRDQPELSLNPSASMAEPNES